MFRKNLPYWLKGGIVFGIIGLILGGLGLRCLFGVSEGFGGFSCLMFLPSYLLSWSFILSNPDSILASPLFIFFENIALFFVIGAILGFVHGKTKKYN